ncbi:MAG: hypothetical protein LUF68_04460 [Clostridiales bacterium]|nr:hypothetical protein [Clostridiales bacterium]
MGRKGGKKGGGKGSFLDNPFGGMFDFNRDGREGFGELWLGTQILRECTKKDTSHRDYHSPNLPLFPARDVFDDVEDDLGVDIDSEDYESEEEYEEEEEAPEPEHVRIARPAPVTIPISLSFELSYPGKEALETIKESDYPNGRKYDAAYHLCEVKHGSAFIPSNSSPEKEIARCEFILNSDTVAARYLTVFDGFLFAQAVKENFSLPITVPDEDKEAVTDFGNLFLELAEEDTPLAVKVWSWCIQEFGPYCHYMKSTRILYNGIHCSAGDYPPDFVDLVLQEMAANSTFLTGLLEKNPDFPAAETYIAYALEHEQPDIAARIFRSAIAHPAGKGKKLENFIYDILSCCENWDELETVESFKSHILPVVVQIEDKRIQRLLPQFRERVDHYIDTVESSSERYRYTRRFAWRKTCIDGSAYGINPLRYKTEEEYNEAILQRKYGWRQWRSREAAQFGLAVTDYETEADFKAAVAEIRRKQHPAKVKQTETDPLADTDMTVYTFCGVVFPRPIVK